MGWGDALQVGTRGPAAALGVVIGALVGVAVGYFSRNEDGTASYWGPTGLCAFVGGVLGYVSTLPA
jgi:hypothetical protein